MRRPLSLWHLTILTGHARRQSPRAEVDDRVLARLRPILDTSGGALWDSGWGVLVIERSADCAVYDLSAEGIEVARCWLARAAGEEDRLWREAAAMPSLPGVVPRKPARRPWLAAGLLPDGMLLLRSRPQWMLELGDLERCVAWALIETAAR